MNRVNGWFSSLALVFVCGLRLDAATPRLGGPMKHILVSQVGNQLVVGLEGDPLERLTMRRYDEMYDPPADVLNGKYYNGQYGWLANGFFNLPPGSAVWVRREAHSPALEAYEALTFLPIFGTDGSSEIWQWSGVMVHNWYAAVACGDYQASYTVYVGDAAGTPLSGWGAASVMLYWRAGEPLPGDLDHSGTVDLADLSTLLSSFGSSGVLPEDGDLDGDGAVTLADLSVLLENFGASCE